MSMLLPPKADAPLWLARWLEDEAYGLKHRPEVAVVFLFQSIESSRELGVSRESRTKVHEGTHDLDVDGDGSRTLEDAREHCHTLLREDVRAIATAAVATRS